MSSSNKSYSIEEIRRGMALWEAVNYWMNPPGVKKTPLPETERKLLVMEKLHELVVKNPHGPVSFSSAIRWMWQVNGEVIKEVSWLELLSEISRFAEEDCPVDLPEVDMDEVHESPKIRKHFTMTDAFINGLPNSLSKDFLSKYRKKYMDLEVAEFEQKIIDNQNAMERLQELGEQGHVVQIDEKQAGKDWKIRTIEPHRVSDTEWAPHFTGEFTGDTLPRTILNIKIGESQGRGYVALANVLRDFDKIPSRAEVEAEKENKREVIDKKISCAMCGGEIQSGQQHIRLAYHEECYNLECQSLAAMERLKEKIVANEWSIHKCRTKISPINHCTLELDYKNNLSEAILNIEE